jgi:hypothetical protein
MNDDYISNIIEALEKIKKEPPRNIGGKYHNEICDDEEIKRQQKFLMDLITKHKSPIPEIDENGNFIAPPLLMKIVDNDCTFGKTTLSLYAIIELYNSIFTENWRVIWVADKKEDCKKNAQKLNELLGFDLGVAITGEISASIRKNYAKNFDVIFITHERYRRLARYYNEGERDFLKYNRQLLIIDEKIQMNRVITFSFARYYELKEEIQKLGGTRAVAIYDKIVKPLVDYIRAKTIDNVYKKGIIYQFQANLKDVKNNIEKLKLLIKEKSNNQIKFEDFDEEDYQTIYEKVEDLREFFVGRCIVNVEKKKIILQVPNYSIQMWGLSNNIILDATAYNDISYQYNNLFKLFHQKRIIKYTHWTIRYANINTTSNARVEKYKNFYDVTNELIEELGENETLVLADLYDDEESISKTSSKRRKKNVFKGTVTHRGQRGSNTFKNIKNFINACYLYEGESSYILEYLYYNRNAEIKNWSSVNWVFQDEELENFKAHKVAIEFYQLIKRINRNMEYESNVIFLSHNEAVTKLVLEMFEEVGANIIHDTEIENRFIEIEKIHKPKKPRKINQFKELCQSILRNEIPSSFERIFEDKQKYKEMAEQGKFAKYLFYTTLEISNKSFGNNILRNKKGIIKAFLEKNNIENQEKGKYIIFPNFHI